MKFYTRDMQQKLRTLAKNIKGSIKRMPLFDRVSDAKLSAMVMIVADEFEPYTIPWDVLNEAQMRLRYPPKRVGPVVDQDDLLAVFDAIGGLVLYEWHTANPHLGSSGCPMCDLWHTDVFNQMVTLAKQRESEK